MPLRLKTRPVVFVGNTFTPQTVYENGFYRNPGPLTVEQCAGSDRISYFYNGDRRAFNVCDHDEDRELDSNAVPLELTTRCSNTTMGWNDLEFDGHRPPYFCSPTPWYVGCVPTSSQIIDATSELSSAQYDAYLNVCAGTPGREMNTIRSAMELKDTKQTITSLAGLVRWGAKALRQTPGASRFWSCAKVAELYLTYQFGIAPTYRDVQQFISELSKGSLVVRGIPRIIGKGVVLKSSFGVSPSKTIASATQGLTLSHNESRNTWVGWSPPWFMQRCGYSPSCPYSSSLKRYVLKTYKGVVFSRCTRTMVIDGVDKLSRKFIWSCPLVKTLWDLTPFSFLVDWFIDIGSSIRRLEQLSMIGNFNMAIGPVWVGTQTDNTVCYPRVSCTTNSVISGGRAEPGVWPVHCDSSSRVEAWIRKNGLKSYRREPFLVPANALLPAIHWKLSAYQLSTGMALIVSLANSLKRAR